MAKAKLPIDELPANSKFRPETTEETAELVTIKPVVSKGGSKRIKKKETLISNFLSESASSVWSYLVMEVLVPAAKTTVQDLITSGIEMLLYGESSGRRPSKKGSNGRTIVSYGSYHNSSRRRERETERGIVTYGSKRRGSAVDDIVIEDRGEAQDVLSSLLDLLEEYEQVSIADLYELAGIDGGSYIDHKWGWTNLRDARIRKVSEGYLLELPPTEELED